MLGVAAVAAEAVVVVVVDMVEDSNWNPGEVEGRKEKP